MPTGISRYRQRGAARDRIAEVLMAATAPLTTPALAERCRLSRALVAAELAALERAGWVERRQGTGGKQPDAWSWRPELGGAVA